MVAGLPAAEYELIIGALRRALGSMEEAPKPYESQGEEALRHVLLTALNAAFASSTTAESFRGRGKTDLLVRIEGRVVYVGECKIWSGPAALHRALDQLLGYGTWRDSGMGLVLFVRSKHFTRGVGRAREAFATHPEFRGWLDAAEDVGDHEQAREPLRMRVAQTADPDREAIVTVQFAHLPVERSTLIDGEISDLQTGLQTLLDLRRSVGGVAEHGVKYPVGLSTPGASPPPEPGSLMRHERRTPEGRVTADAVPEDEDAARRYAPAGAILPEESADGDRVRMLIDEALRWGVGVEAAGGFAIRMDRYPPGMHPFVERLERQDNLRIVLKPSTQDAWPIDVGVSTDRGEASATMHFRVVDPPEGFDAAIRGSFNNLSLTLAFTRTEPGRPQRQEFAWALHPTDASVSNRLAALDFLYALSGAGELTMHSRNPMLPSTMIKLEENELDEDIIFDRAVMADLHIVESWLGRHLDVPEQIPGHQINELAAVAQAIRTGHWQANWRQIEFATETATVPDKRDDWRANLMTPLEAELFGQRTRLGMGYAELHFDIAATRVDPDDPAKTWLTIVPHDAEMQEIEASELRQLDPGEGLDGPTPAS
jgi:hypothetical protein